MARTLGRGGVAGGGGKLVSQYLVRGRVRVRVRVKGER